MEAISYDNKNIGGFLDRFMVNDNPPQVTENFLGTVLIEGNTGPSNTFPRGIKCDTFFNNHKKEELIKYKVLPTASRKPVKDEFKKCPLYFPALIDKNLCESTTTPCPKLKHTSVCSDDDCIIIKRLESDIADSKPSNHVSGIYRRIQHQDNGGKKNDTEKDKIARNNNKTLTKLTDSLKTINMTVDLEAQAWERDFHSIGLYEDYDDMEEKKSFIFRADGMWIIASKVDFPKYYGSTELFNDDWNIGILMTGDEKYGWFDPENSLRSQVMRKPKLGIVTHNLLNKTTREISEKQYHNNLFKTSNIEYYETSPSPRKISSFPDYYVNSKDTGVSHTTSYPKSEYYDTMRIVYIKPDTKNGKYKFLPPYIFNDDYSKSQSVLYGIGPIWDPRRYQDVYQKNVDQETIKCQSESYKTDSYPGNKKFAATATLSPCRTFNMNIIDSLSPSPVPSPSKSRDEFFGEPGKEFNTLYGSMKDSHEVVSSKSPYWRYTKDKNPSHEYLYNSIAGHKKNSYLRAVTKLYKPDYTDYFLEDKSMEKMGGFLEDCNFRACKLDKINPQKTNKDIYYSEQWFNSTDSKIESSESKIFIGPGEKPCPTTQRCNNPYINYYLKCNIPAPSKCPSTDYSIIPAEVWRKKLGYSESETDKIIFEKHLKTYCSTDLVKNTNDNFIHKGPIFEKKDGRKGLYKKDGQIILLKKSRSCRIPCIYKGLTKTECKNFGKSWGGVTSNLCQDSQAATGEPKITSQTTSLPEPNAPPKISWQICDTLGEKMVCPIEGDNFNSNTFSNIQEYQKSNIHNFKIIASTSPLEIEKCLPKARGIVLGNNKSFNKTNFLNENENCQPKCHVKKDNDIPLPPTHTLNVYTGRIECKYGSNISGEVECKKKCLLPAKINNTFKNIPPICKSKSTQYNDKVTEINNYLQKTFYEDPKDFHNKKDKYKNFCELYNADYSPPPSPIKIPNVNGLCADLNELDDKEKCIYMEKIGDNNTYKEVTCNGGELSPSDVTSSGNLLNNKCENITNSPKDMTSFPTPSKGKYFGILVDETKDNPQLTSPIPGVYVNTLCSTPTKTKITKFHGCTLSPVYDKDEQLTKEYIGRGCYKMREGNLSLQHNITNQLCSPSPRKIVGTRGNEKCIEELNTLVKSISTVTPNKLTVTGYTLKKGDKFILKNKHSTSAPFTSTCPTPVKNNIYEFTDSNGDITPTLAPAATTTGRTNIKDNCQIKLIKQYNKHDINKGVCNADTNSEYMEGIPENSEVVKCPVNSEHLGKCDFKCKEGYDLFTADKNDYIKKSNFKAFCYKGKWIPFIKINKETKRVVCKEKGCGYLNETLKFPPFKIDGLEYTPVDFIVKKTTEYPQGELPWKKGKKSKHLQVGDESIMKCNKLKLLGKDNVLKGVDEIKMINDFGIKCKKGGKLEYVFNKVLNIEEIKGNCILTNRPCFKQGKPENSCQMDTTKTLNSNQKVTFIPRYDEIKCNQDKTGSGYTCGCKEGWYGTGYSSQHPKTKTATDSKTSHGCTDCGGKMTSDPSDNLHKSKCYCPPNSTYNKTKKVCECDEGYKSDTTNEINDSYKRSDKYILKCIPKPFKNACMGLKGDLSDKNNVPNIFEWAPGITPEPGECTCKSPYNLSNNNKLIYESSKWLLPNKENPKCVLSAKNCNCPNGNSAKNCLHTSTDKKFIEDNPTLCDGANDEDKCTNIRYSSSPSTTPCKFIKNPKCPKGNTIYCETCKPTFTSTEEIIDQSGKEYKFCYDSKQSCHINTPIQYYQADRLGIKPTSNNCIIQTICGTNEFILKPGTEGSETKCGERCKDNEIAWTSTRNKKNKLDSDARKNGCKVKRKHSPYCKVFNKIGFDPNNGLSTRKNRGVCKTCNPGYLLNKGQCFHKYYNNTNKPSLSKYEKDTLEVFDDKSEYYLFKLAIKSLKQKTWNVGIPESSYVISGLEQKLNNIFKDYFDLEYTGKDKSNFINNNYLNGRIKVEKEKVEAIVHDKVNNYYDILNVVVLIKPQINEFKNNLTYDMILEALNNDGEPINYEYSGVDYYIVGFPIIRDEIIKETYKQFTSKANDQLNQLCEEGYDKPCVNPPSDILFRRCSTKICTKADYSKDGTCCRERSKPIQPLNELILDETLKTLYKDVLSKTEQLAGDTEYFLNTIEKFFKD